MVAHLLAAYAGFVAFVASAGYAFGGTTFWLINDYTAIAIHTAIGLLVAVAAALMTHPETGWLRDVSGSPSAWALLSRFLPVAAILPIALGFMMMRSEEHTSELQSLMRISYAVFCLKKK